MRVVMQAIPKNNIGQYNYGNKKRTPIQQLDETKVKIFLKTSPLENDNYACIPSDDDMSLRNVIRAE